MENMKKIEYKAAEKFVYELFCKAGMNEEDAKWCSVTIVRANLRGIDSHGVLRVPIYFKRILCNAINQNPNIKVKQLAPAISLVDGDNAAGCVAARKAMEMAVENAEKAGIGMAGVINSNHFGTASEFAQIAVDAGMIGVAMTNVKPLITAPGVKKKLVGNNPIAIGVPTYNDFPFMLDMALSVAAEGKLILAASKGMEIPDSWASDPDGKPTTDPNAALKGFLLPIGGFKGLGLAYVVDILTGVITSGVFADKIKSMYADATKPSQIGHMMTAIKLEAFVDKDTMKQRMKSYHNYVVSAPVMAGAAPLCFPGEMEHNCEINRRIEGIPVSAEILNELNALAETYHIAARLL